MIGGLFAAAVGRYGPSCWRGMGQPVLANHLRCSAAIAPWNTACAIELHSEALVGCCIRISSYETFFLILLRPGISLLQSHVSDSRPVPDSLATGSLER